MLQYLRHGYLSDATMSKYGNAVYAAKHLTPYLLRFFNNSELTRS